MGQTQRLLIENKVNAQLQPRQAERYQARGQTYITRAECGAFLTVLVAPRAYLGPLGSPRGFDSCVSYEQVRQWFIDQPELGARAHYKISLLSAAINKGSAVYHGKEDDAVTAFWRDYWSYVSEHAPQWLMPRPGPKPAGSTFIQVHPSDLPSGVNLLHKLSTGHADLQFSGYGERLVELHDAFSAKMDTNMVIAPAGNSGVIRIRIPMVNVGIAFSEQLAEIVEGIDALRQLHRWWKTHGSGHGLTQ